MGGCSEVCLEELSESSSPAIPSWGRAMPSPPPIPLNRVSYAGFVDIPSSCGPRSAGLHLLRDKIHAGRVPRLRGSQSTLKNWCHSLARCRARVSRSLAFRVMSSGCAWGGSYRLHSAGTIQRPVLLPGKGSRR